MSDAESETAWADMNCCAGRVKWLLEVKPYWMLTCFSNTYDPLLTKEINHNVSLPFTLTDLFLITSALFRKAFIIEKSKDNPLDGPSLKEGCRMLKTQFYKHSGFDSALYHYRQSICQKVTLLLLWPHNLIETILSVVFAELHLPSAQIWMGCCLVPPVITQVLSLNHPFHIA